jgi:hypothetical protein
MKPTVQEAEKALYDTIKILESLGITFMLDGGTLLGFFRDKTFCEDDHNDIDLTTNLLSWDRHEDISSSMLDAGFHVHHMWHRDDKKHQTGQYAWKRNGVKIDLMFKEVKEENIWWTVYGSKSVTYKSVPYAIAGYLQENTIKLIGKNVKVKMPINTPEYLAYRYGDWRTPLHRSLYSCYTTDKCIVDNYKAI